MKLFAIADLHLSFGVKHKEMDVFGEKWKRHHEKLETHWREVVSPDDLVLIAGDISWALHLEEARPDLEWIDRLPGTKVMIKGNHDLWWKSKAKVEAILPKSIHLVYNSAFTLNGVTVGGTRLWDSPLVDYSPHITFIKPPPEVHIHRKEDTPEEKKHDEKIYKSEVSRLAWSLDAMSRDASLRIVMLHYPPVGPDLAPNEVTRLLENESVDYCVYGHVHNLKEGSPMDFSIGGVRYICTAADWLDFKPRELKAF